MTLLDELLGRGTVLLDGAWGTELQARGLGAGETPDLWNLAHPDRVEAVARAYVEAGSDVILTNTFRANAVALARHGEGPRVGDINRSGVEISRRAAGTKARVFASMGPSGQLLRSGDVDAATVKAAFEEQARALATAGADALVLETFSDLEEAALALAAARETGLPVVACMAFDSGKNRDRTMMGTTPEEAAAALAVRGADVVGANCGSGVDGLVRVCERLASATDRPVWIKANAGLPVLEGGEVVYRTTPEEFAAHFDGLVEAGAAFIGGCCGTTPAFVAALRDRRARQGGALTP